MLICWCMCVWAFGASLGLTALTSRLMFGSVLSRGRLPLLLHRESRRVRRAALQEVAAQELGQTALARVGGAGSRKLRFRDPTQSVHRVLAQVPDPQAAFP